MKRLINKGLSALMATVMLMTVTVSAPFVVNADDTERNLFLVRKQTTTTALNTLS